MMGARMRVEDAENFEACKYGDRNVGVKVQKQSVSRILCKRIDTHRRQPKMWERHAEANLVFRPSTRRFWQYPQVAIMRPGDPPAFAEKSDLTTVAAKAG
ncbi:MAG: hypothetical protein AAFN70_19760, partial [Planctomycetota bacterium]